MAAPHGHELFCAAFPDVDLDSLARAVIELGDRGSQVVPALMSVVDVREWQRARAALHALRRCEPPAVAAATTVAGWVAFRAPEAHQPEHEHTVNEALNGLRELRDALDAPPVPEVAEPYRVVAEALDGVFQPHLLSWLVAPMKIWHRGVVRYLRGRHGESAAVAAAAGRYLSATAADVRTGDHDWSGYTRAEAARLLAELYEPPRRRAVPEYKPGPVPQRQLAPELAPLDTAELQRLVDVAESGPDVRARIAALEALAVARAPADLIRAVALRAATSVDRHERAAAVLLLAGLA